MAADSLAMQELQYIMYYATQNITFPLQASAVALRNALRGRC
jgi:hypothetical protein